VTRAAGWLATGQGAAGRRAWIFLAVLACGLAACGRRSAATADASRSRELADGGTLGLEAGPGPEEPQITDAWSRAVDGGADDLARLEEAVGMDGLVAAASWAPRRVAALRALAFAEDFTALPFLATVAASGSEDEATSALESAACAASRPRLATDPEDALEVREGISRLLVLARDLKVARPRRILAVRVLRLFADRGWVQRAELPTDLDAR